MRRVATRVDLIGGPSALGEIGDFLLENDKIGVIIQDKGFSRLASMAATDRHRSGAPESWWHDGGRPGEGPIR